MKMFRRGWTVLGDSRSGQLTLAQLWVPKEAVVVAHPMRLHVYCTTPWHLVGTSTRLANQPFGASPRLRNGISVDGMFGESLCEIRDERKAGVDGAMYGSFPSGSHDLQFDLAGPYWHEDSFVIRPDMNDATETGAGLLFRSEVNGAVFRLSLLWAEENRLDYEARTFRLEGR